MCEMTEALVWYREFQLHATSVSETSIKVFKIATYSAGEVRLLSQHE